LQQYEIIKLPATLAQGAGNCEAARTVVSSIPESASPPRRIDTRDNVSKPAEENEPEKSAHNEMNYCRKNSSLDQLTETGDEKTDQCRDDVSGGSLTHSG
jgi:hypothetical protein